MSKSLKDYLNLILLQTMIHPVLLSPRQMMEVIILIQTYFSLPRSVFNLIPFKGALLSLV